jgi:hypothetical protein
VEQDVLVRVRNDMQRLPVAQLQVLLRRGALPQGNFMYDVRGESQGDGSLTMVLSDAQPGVYYAVRWPSVKRSHARASRMFLNPPRSNRARSFAFE